MRHPAAHISDHLLVYLTLSFTAGIAIAPRASLPQSALTHLGPALLICLSLLLLLHFLKWRRTILCLFPLLLAALGFYHAQLALQVPQGTDHIFNRIKEKTETIVIGTLATSPAFNGKTSQVMVSTEYIRFHESSAFLPTTGNILLHCQGEWPATLLPGDKLLIRADLKRPDSFHSPGAFDYAQYLARNGIWINGFVRSPLFLQKITETQNIIHILHYFPERLRTRIGAHIDISVPTESQGLYRAILIGDRSRVDDAILETFKGSGTMHILAISGLHMTVIGTLLFTAIYWLLNRSKKLLFRYPLRKWAALLCLPVLLGYGLLAGLNIPVFRAVVMSCMVIVAVCTDRPKSPSTLMACAALIILTIEPLALLTASFQLSFVATMAILFLFPILKKLTVPDANTLPRTKIQAVVDWLIAAMLVSIVATLATTPISLFAFNRFSPMSIFSNLLVEPLICLWSLPAGFLSIPFIFLQPEIGTWLLHIGSLGLSTAVQATTYFSGLPFSTLWLPSPPWSLMIGFYGGVTGCCLLGRSAGMWLWFSAVLMTLCLILMLYSPTFLGKRPPASFHLSFIDVGQGSATVAEFPSGMTVLIDGGGSSSATGTVGERVIAPYLWHRGITKLDAVAITHPDADHYNGLAFILKHFSPAQLWVRDRYGHDKGFKQLIHLAEEQQIKVITPQVGAMLDNGDTSNFLECITNTAVAYGTSHGSRESQNQANAGIIIKACSKQHCSLFPGDIGRDDEQFLVDQGYNLTADILLAPHHGSKSSNSLGFLAAVSPSLMVVSAGRSMPNNFPHSHLQDDCEKMGITLLTTSKHGTLEAIIGQESTKVFGYAKKQNNPLHSYEQLMVHDSAEMGQ
ncbi:MAG: DNA internalization-related competence protein ComEC/Rec2 [Pseudomonadota bacterium]